MANRLDGARIRHGDDCGRGAASELRPAQRPRDGLGLSSPPEWGEAERGVLSNPRLVDAYRKTRKRGSPFAVSHRTRTRDCRYDHIYVTGHFDVTSCRYLTDWLDENLSDHAPVVADLKLTS